MKIKAISKFGYDKSEKIVKCRNFAEIKDIQEDLTQLKDLINER